jgi:hypothetical protein
MKKLLLVLLVITIASFLFVGCLPTTPSEGEGEGEGEGECETIVVIDGAVVVDGKTYVSGGNHDITVTFCAPVDGSVSTYITDCNGDYSKDLSGDVVMFPNADRTVWTGSGYFGYGDGCCASYVQVASGECLADVCIEFPVIVDSADPYALVEIDVENCTCEGCKLIFTTGEVEGECAPDTECCGDDCAGLASWSIVLYEGYPFDECCDPSICEEPIGSCSGTTCPIECTTECLDPGTYWAVVTLVDNVGNESVYYAEIVLTGGTSESDTCEIIVAEYVSAPAPDCVQFDETHDWVGTCEDVSVDEV